MEEGRLEEGPRIMDSPIAVMPLRKPRTQRRSAGLLIAAVLMVAYGGIKAGIRRKAPELATAKAVATLDWDPARPPARQRLVGTFRQRRLDARRGAAASFLLVQLSSRELPPRATL